MLIHQPIRRNDVPPRSLCTPGAERGDSGRGGAGLEVTYQPHIAVVCIAHLASSMQGPFERPSGMCQPLNGDCDDNSRSTSCVALPPWLTSRGVLIWTIPTNELSPPRDLSPMRTADSKQEAASGTDGLNPPPSSSLTRSQTMSQEPLSSLAAHAQEMRDMSPSLTEDQDSLESLLARIQSAEQHVDRALLLTEALTPGGAAPPTAESRAGTAWPLTDDAAGRWLP